MHGGGGHAVDDGAAEMQVGIESGAEAVDEGRRAEARRAAGARTVSAQALLHQSQEQAQGGALEIGIALWGCWFGECLTTPAAGGAACPTIRACARGCLGAGA